MKIIASPGARPDGPNCSPQFSAGFLALAMAAAILGPITLKAIETDERIEAAVKSSFVFRTYLLNDSVKTTSNEAVVTLSGSVKDASHRQLAEDTVSGLPDVKSVDNQIQTKDSPVENSDRWLYARVKSTLAYHRSVSAYNTQVVIRKGVAALKGEASSPAQKELVGAYTKDIVGIKDVINDITVTNPGPSHQEGIGEVVDDASTTAQVRMTLLSHRSTSMIRTTVSTKEGIVTLAGKANDAAELGVVSKLVTDIHGVKSVINNMTVAMSSAASN